MIFFLLSKDDAAVVQLPAACALWRLHVTAAPSLAKRLVAGVRVVLAACHRATPAGCLQLETQQPRRVFSSTMLIKTSCQRLASMLTLTTV